MIACFMRAGLDNAPFLPSNWTRAFRVPQVGKLITIVVPWPGALWRMKSRPPG